MVQKTGSSDVTKRRAGYNAQPGELFHPMEPFNLLARWISAGTTWRVETMTVLMMPRDTLDLLPGNVAT